MTKALRLSTRLVAVEAILVAGLLCSCAGAGSEPDPGSGTAGTGGGVGAGVAGGAGAPSGIAGAGGQAAGGASGSMGIAGAAGGGHDAGPDVTGAAGGGQDAGVDVGRADAGADNGGPAGAGGSVTGTSGGASGRGGVDGGSGGSGSSMAGRGGNSAAGSGGAMSGRGGTTGMAGAMAGRGGSGGGGGAGGSGGSTTCSVSPVNPNATPQARKLLCYLYSLYGKNVLSGQQETSWSNPANDVNWYNTNVGKYPAILGGDYLYPSGTTSRAQAYWNAGGITMIRYHMGAPPGSDTYENSQGTANIANVLASGTRENNSFKSKLDYIAAELQTLENANVAVLWAPFHEYQPSGWFWWSKGTRQPVHPALAIHVQLPDHDTKG